MSWNASGTAENGVLTLTLNTYGQAVSKDTEEAFEEGRSAAEMILGSGVVGSKDKRYVVAVNGHSNPGHEPVQGMANDYITVSVTQVNQLVQQGPTS